MSKHLKVAEGVIDEATDADSFDEAMFALLGGLVLQQGQMLDLLEKQVGMLEEDAKLIKGFKL
tara:strand:+ start:359 stop:547 length:189 start_codon:yes stop_codon:yes gene_type:complete